MKTYLAFIDESGNYQQTRTEAFCRRFPYYVKACVLIPTEHWPQLRDHRNTLITKIGISPLEELKWSHIWKLRRRDVDGKNISLSDKESFLKNISFEQANQYAKDLVATFPTYDPVVICTITPNCVFRDRVADINLERLHFQNIMQRIEMEIQWQDGGALAILFADQLSEKNQEREIRARYSELFHGGDLIRQYAHIFDTITFSDSRQCCGLQLADFVAGFIVGFLRGFPVSRDIVALKIMDEIRKGTDDNTIGYGIIDVPHRDECRQHLKDKFANVLPF